MTLTQREMRVELQRQIDASGGIMIWCRARGITHASVSFMLSGKRPVSEAVANAAGFLMEPTFRKIK